jgi:hypothetical protein
MKRAGEVSVGAVGADGEVSTRLQDVQAADRVVLKAWWAARLALNHATERHDRVRVATWDEQRRLLGGMTDRQRSSTERGLNAEAAPRVTAAARTHLRRMVWARTRVAEVDARGRERDAACATAVVDARRVLAEATGALLTQVPWAAELTSLTKADLRQLAAGES